MGKRSNFDRNPRDYYPTPYKAALPLMPHIRSGSKFVEPCAGDGRLIKHLEKNGNECVYACDIEPQAKGIEKQDALFFGFKLPACTYIITNPPWEREYLHAMIDSFRRQAITWLLLDADWMLTVQASSYLKYCSKIVAVGRVSWQGNGVAGKDNCAWYCFVDYETDTQFIGRK